VLPPHAQAEAAAAHQPHRTAELLKAHLLQVRVRVRVRARARARARDRDRVRLRVRRRAHLLQGSLARGGDGLSRRCVLLMQPRAPGLRACDQRRVVRLGRGGVRVRERVRVRVRVRERVRERVRVKS